MIIVALFIILVISLVALSIALFPAKIRDNLTKITAFAVVIIFLSVLFGGVLYGALAEEESIDTIEVSEFVSVEPILFDEEALLLISFEYHGEILSWYEEGVFYTGRTYVVTIFNNVEVIDAYLLCEEVDR